MKKVKKYWWLNEESQAVLNRGYLLKGETVEDAVKRITTAMAERLNMLELQPKFQEIVELGYVSLSSPIWANMGTKRGLPISCNNVHLVDNIEGIFEKLSEVGMQTKLGAGTSGYFGELRGRGASITDNGKSSGAVSFMQLFDTAMSVVSQGCFKGNAEILTKDGFIPFKELIETRDKEIITFDFDTQSNIVYFPTKPLDYIKYNYSGDIYKFKYKDFEIEVTADHNMLLVADNYDTFTVTAEELEKTFEDWKHLNLAILPSGEVENFKLIPLKNIIITTHKFNNPVYCVEVETHNIIVRNNKKGIPILISNSTRRGSFASYLDIDHPDIKEFLQIKDIGHPIQNLFYGVCIPDYWMQEMIDGDDEKREIWAKILESRQQKGLPYLFFTDNVNKNKPEIYKKLGLKINASNLCVAGNTEIKVCLTNKETQFCEKIVVLPIKEVIEYFETGNYDITVLSYNIEKNNYEYNKITKIFKQGIKKCNKYIIGEKEFLVTPNHKFLTEDLEFEEIHKIYESGKNLFTHFKRDIKFSFIGEEDCEVFDITVDKTHNFICYIDNKPIPNLIVLSNCSEIALPSTKDESFVCCLASLNLELYDEWKDTNTVKLLTYMLEAVMEEYIVKTENVKFMEASHKFSKRHRAIGIGTLGLHSYYQKLGRPFGHPLNIGLNKQIFSYIKEESYKASEELAKILGPAPIFLEVLKQGIELTEPLRRHTTLLSIAPTTSSSAILGAVSPGIEPYSSNYFKANLAKGNFIRKNKYLVKLLEEKGKNDEDTWRDIMVNQGSVQHLNFLTNEEKDIFKTFKEISQADIILQACVRQEFIDQSQSLNINIPPDVSPKEVNKLIIDGWKQGLKTLYYQRSQSVSKELLTNIVNCSSCES